MLDIKRKDMPLKSWITTYETKIDDPKMDKQIKKIIDKQGDRQKHNSNVKAQMTEWHMHNELGFKKLVDISIDIAKRVSLNKYNRNIDFKLNNLWGMK